MEDWIQIRLLKTIDPVAKMQFSLLTALFSLLALGGAQAPGYDDGSIPSTVPANETGTLSFGQHYAILNLDLITGLVGNINTTTQGEQFIDNVAKWINATNALDPKPLTIYTRIYFSNRFKPEVGPDAPFAKTVAALGNVTAADAITEIYPAFTVQEDRGDVVLQKTRYYAGANNGLELILKTQHIDTVILVRLRRMFEVRQAD